MSKDKHRKYLNQMADVVQTLHVGDQPNRINRVAVGAAMQGACTVFTQLAEDQTYLRNYFDVFNGKFQSVNGEPINTGLSPINALESAFEEWGKFIDFERHQFMSLGIYPYQADRILRTIEDYLHLIDVNNLEKYSCFQQFRSLFNEVAERVCKAKTYVTDTYNPYDVARAKGLVTLDICGGAIGTANTAGAFWADPTFILIQASAALGIVTLGRNVIKPFKKD